VVKTVVKTHVKTIRNPAHVTLCSKDTSKDACQGSSKGSSKDTYQDCRLSCPRDPVEKIFMQGQTWVLLSKGTRCSLKIECVLSR
jgi:uncharacterized membrane protein